MDDHKGKAKGIKISKKSQEMLVNFAVKILESSRNTELVDKMECIDIAYARYKTTNTGGDVQVANVFEQDNVIAPIVVSQVDSIVAYLAEVFLTGSPLFPVVSTPAKRKMAEQLETLMDDHAMLGGYARQLLLFLRDAVKYNVAALEADWNSIEQLNVTSDYLEGQATKRDNKYITKVTRLDMYNVIMDNTVLPGDVSEKGDYAGYIDILSRTKLKTFLNSLTKNDESYNVAEAISDRNNTDTSYYRTHPAISEYITAAKPKSQTDWDAFFDGVGGRKTVLRASDSERFTLYARIIPSEFGIICPQPNTPQIWKIVVINGKVLVQAKRIISAYDRLPILFGQPLEDGLGYQTQSAAETQIPIQKAATTLFNMRFSAARRAVSDRALYDPTMIDPNDINSIAPAPKIPVRVNPLSKAGIAAAYQQIPFDLRGTETAFQDAAVLVDFSKQLSGVNAPQQGQFQKGNKSVQEWADTMGGSDGRLRLLALCIEHQVFVWLRFILVLNIYQYGEDAVVVSQKTGEVLDIKISELRREVLAFRVADGYTPKSKLASTEMLVNGLTMLMNSPVLQQAYGTMLPAMFAHMMQLGGVRGLEEYAPETQQQAGQVAAPTVGMPQPAMPGLPPQTDLAPV